MNYSIDIKFAKGDKRITYTKEHIITEVVEGINGYRDPIWKILSIEHVDELDKNINVLSNDQM